jgi:hypothetical protein
MEAIMQTLSNTNPVVTHIQFRRRISDHNLEEFHSEITATIAQIARWSIIGICLIAVALPTAISVTSSF